MTDDVQSTRTAAPGFRRLFEPLTIGNFTVRNRFLNAMHGTGIGEARDLRYLQARARGGAGLMGVHASHGVYTYLLGPGGDSATPDWDGKPLSPVTREGIAHYDDVVIPYLQVRAGVIHAEGAKCFGQVFNPGAATHGRVYPPFAPSPVFDPYQAQMPHPLTEDEIAEVIAAYAQAIRRVAEAGLDAAEIHGAHGYLVNEFFSPYFNQRDDRWGGSRENRVRFALAIITEARKLVGPDFPIGIRVGVDGDGKHRGLSVDELAELAALLASHVAYISVSGGNYSGFGDGFEGAYVSPWYREPGFNVPTAVAIKTKVDVPVFVTGRIIDPAIAEGILADEAADMIGMVRALIADPELPNKTRQGRITEIRTCLGLSECHHIGPHRVPMTCAVNAAAAREVEMEIVPAAIQKTVVVVGAGPAGLEAARVAGLRGHRVYLCDSSRQLGGTLAVLGRDPNRRNLLDLVAYFETQLAKIDVQLMLGNEMSAEELAEFSPEVVIVATGGTPLVPQIPGIDQQNVVTGLDVLRGVAEIGQKALVVGGLDNHVGAPTIAEFLADQGKEVELLSEHLDFANGAEDGTRFPLMHRLMTKGVKVSLLHKLASLADGRATVIQTFTREERNIEGVTVVLACGLVPNDHLARELMGKVGEVHLIGDALAPRRVMHATLEGARTAQSV